ncbi:MAG: NAD(P)/FAD-dependent oxidoreductase [Rhodopirellula sp.]|nr:NAD(P)/FAD-dependent oxidoreductase [Rhodopirellula sp.]
MTNDNFDVAIVGGGPAGSTAAAVLAEHGRRVILLEKEEFPRYHIGESLLPFCYFTLQRIGLIDRMKASHFTKKYAVQFVSSDGRLSTPFYFFRHLEHEAAQTWQVVRSEFDKMLLDNARQLGVQVRTGVEVTDFLWDDDRVGGVAAVGPDGRPLEVHVPVTIDASGRSALAAKRNHWRRPDPYLNKVALWTYFRGAARDTGIDEGTTTVAYIPEKGWFWYIPLPDDVVSVGVVAEREYLFRETNDLESIYWREVRNNAWIEQHLQSGERIEEFRITKEYSYRSEYSAADGLVLVGDAFAFLDPVFSSGVYLALRGGELVGDAVHAALTEGNVSAEGFAAYAERLCGEIEAMRKLVYAFYDHSFSFGRLIRDHADLACDVTDCLIGNLNKDFTELFDAVSEQAAIPAPLPHGRPKYGRLSSLTAD